MGPSRGAIHFTLVFCVILSIVDKLHGTSTATIGNHQIVGQMVKVAGMPVAQYLGIPYAAPPTGNLRFKKPVPSPSYPSLYRAYNATPACWQHSNYPFPWYDSNPDKSEDCLYLNIWAPSHATPDNPKAVIYFIHGGGFRFGSIQQLTYDGAPLSAIGDVVVVTVNYRLGPFGFLTTGTDDAPGNVGLYDILEGLKWVNENIGAFGGDTSRITIAGQGSGSVAVGLLSISPLSKGLFQRQIMESGSPALSFDDNKYHNEFYSQKIAALLGCANETFTIQDNPDDVLNCLKGISAETISSVSGTIHPLSSVTFFPQYGNEILPDDPQDAVVDGDMKCNQLLIGSTLDEGSYQITTTNPSLYGFFGYKHRLFNKKAGKRMLKKIFQNFTNTAGVLDQYLPHSVPDNAYHYIRHQVYTATGDASIVCPTIYYAEKCAEGGGDVFFYVWQHRPSNSPWAPWMGATSASEVEFVFGSPFLQPFQFLKEEMQLSIEVIEVWASFAKDGKPLIPWPQYSKESPGLRLIGPGPMFTNDTKFHEDNCNFFRPYYEF